MYPSFIIIVFKQHTSILFMDLYLSIFCLNLILFILIMCAKIKLISSWGTENGNINGKTIIRRIKKEILNKIHFLGLSLLVSRNYQQGIRF